VGCGFLDEVSEEVTEVLFRLIEGVLGGGEDRAGLRAVDIGLVEEVLGGLFGEVEFFLLVLDGGDEVIEGDRLGGGGVMRGEGECELGVGDEVVISFAGDGFTGAEGDEGGFGL